MTDAWIVNRNASAAELAETLREHGLAIVPGALAAPRRIQLYDELDPHFAKAPACEGLFYGRDTRRFGSVLARSREAQTLALDPLALGTARALLGGDCADVQLNLTQAIELSPGSLSQAPHRDREIWLGADFPGEMMLNAMWALDHFTRDNGATMIWPGTHRRPDLTIPECEGVAAEMPAGSLCLFLGSTLHNGGANVTSRPRRGLVISYCLGWLKPAENPWLAYPPHIARTFAPELAALVGYRQDAPSLNQVEGRCPSELLCPRETSAPRPFADRLTPEQAAMIEQYNAMQMAMRKQAA